MISRLALAAARAAAGNGGNARYALRATTQLGARSFASAGSEVRLELLVSVLGRLCWGAGAGLASPSPCCST